jgi:hypothetical protein
MAKNGTLLVMMDTRNAISPIHQKSAQYPQLAFELNRRYACRHGYSVLYLQMRSQLCEHPSLGLRHPSYCKLAAVADGLSRGFAFVVFLDSDSFFQNGAPPLPELLTTFAGEPFSANQSGSRSAAFGTLPPKYLRPPPAPPPPPPSPSAQEIKATNRATPNHAFDWDVAFASDRPFSLGPNAGVQFWRNTPSAHRLLRLWWHLPGGRYHANHDFEQHALQWGLLHLQAHAPRVATLRLQSMAAQLDSRGWPRYDHPVAHIDHGRNFFRALLMSIALLQSEGREVKLPTFKVRDIPASDADAGASSGGTSAPASSAVGRRRGRTGDPRGGGRGRGQGGALRPIGGEMAVPGVMSMRGIEGYQTAQLRKRLIRLATKLLPSHRAAKSPKGAGARAEEELTKADPGSEPGAEGAHGAAKDARGAAKGQRRSVAKALEVAKAFEAPPGRLLPCQATTKTLLETFDPTIRAEQLLGAPLKANPRGTGPSTLVNGIGPSRSSGSESDESEGVLDEAAWGMPLQLVNCSVANDGTAASTHWWQRWSFDDVTGLMRLYMPPGAMTSLSYCLRIGPSRAPRQPDFALAQLWPCPTNEQATRSNSNLGGARMGVNSAVPDAVVRFEHHQSSSERIAVGAIATRLKVQASIGLPSPQAPLGVLRAAAATKARPAKRRHGAGASTRGAGGRRLTEEDSQTDGASMSVHTEAHAKARAAIPYWEAPAATNSSRRRRRHRALQPSLASVEGAANTTNKRGRRRRANAANHADEAMAAHTLRQIASRGASIWARVASFLRGYSTLVIGSTHESLAAVGAAARNRSVGHGSGLRRARLQGTVGRRTGNETRGAWRRAIRRGRGADRGKGVGKGRGKARGNGVGRGSIVGLSPEEVERRRKRKEWRLARRSSFMGQTCVSIHQTSKGGDKKYEDCEDWCAEAKVGHCRYCKCRGCKHCHGDLSLPDWVFGAAADQQCAAFGLCANQSVTYPLCLSVWKGEVHEGAPMVWSRCRTDRFAHQQWQRVPASLKWPSSPLAGRSVDQPHREGIFMLQNGPVIGSSAAGTGEPLCVAAPMPMHLLRSQT